jgi:S1-C subfamily serine protease
MLEPMSMQLAQFFGVSSGGGLLVRSVAANSPAEQAGIHAGDVVLRADSKQVASTADWAKAIKNSRGQPMSVTVLRDKKEQTVTLKPDAKKRSSVDEPGEDSDRGAVAHIAFSWAPRS